MKIQLCIKTHVNLVINIFTISVSCLWFQMMRALLRAEGFFVTRQRVRAMLTYIDPAAAARRWSATVARRTYHVPYPNSLWHMDGNTRLIRYSVVFDN